MSHPNHPIPKPGTNAYKQWQKEHCHHKSVVKSPIKEHRKHFLVPMPAGSQPKVETVIIPAFDQQGFNTYVCPLCNQEITGDNVSVVEMNNKPIKVHKECPNDT